MDIPGPSHSSSPQGDNTHIPSLTRGSGCVTKRVHDGPRTAMQGSEAEHMWKEDKTGQRDLRTSHRGAWEGRGEGAVHIGDKGGQTGAW